QIRFHTEFGQELFVIGNHPLLGDNDVRKAVPLSYFNEDFWYTTLEWPTDTPSNQTIVYNYVLKNTDGTTVIDWGTDKQFNLSKNKQQSY
ncbi:carbohydrate-binding module family 20 domain-containing protein, partial [Streptomyces turgidiscabies]|uniref:carbohydrate-binding module family 20 domain-containing protein n=1 Tax=Streptomyces turgidiscabies TaxID=85558 RepID=UPI0038F6B3D4